MRLSYGSSFLVAAGLAPALVATPGLAQQPIQLPGIYVQGATLEAPSAPAAAAPPATAAGAPADSIAGVPAYTIGNAVSVITGEEMRRQQIRHAADALRSLPGVAIGRSGSFGNLTEVRIRGAEHNHTLVLIDGIEANTTTDGAFDFSNLLAEDIERIEVIRGPMSGLYGSNAVGGVVNIITRKGSGPPSVVLRAEAGSFGTRDVAARFAAGSDKAHIAVSGTWRDTDGFNIAPQGNEKDGAQFGSVAIKGGARLLPGVTLDFTMRRTDKVADRDGFGGFVPGDLATAFDDLSTLRHRIFLAGANLRWDTLGGMLTHELFANRNTSVTEDTDRTFGSFLRNSSDADKFGYLATARFATGALKQSITGRIEQEQERFTPSGSFADGLLRERGRQSYTGEWRGGFAETLFLTAGIRRDDNDNFQDFTTWRTAASLVLRDLNMRPHASIGTAVKLPTMFEQFGTDQFFCNNPNLTPEKSFGWDGGVEFTLLKGKAILDVTYFRANLRDKINGFAPAAFPCFFTAENLPGESTREGVEVSVRFKVTDQLTLGGSYTYTDARDPDGLREVRRPPHSGKADLAYAFAGGRGTFSLAAIYNGTMEDIAFVLPGFFPQPRVALDAYWLVNATVAYKLQPGVEVYGRVENLLDRRYQEVFGFEAAPIAAYAGIKLTLGGPEGVGGAWAK